MIDDGDGDGDGDDDDDNVLPTTNEGRGFQVLATSCRKLQCKSKQTRDNHSKQGMTALHGNRPEL